MKRSIFFLSLLGLVSLAAGCANLELAGETPPDRVIKGTVLVRTLVPAGAQVTVRLLDLAARETSKNPLNDMAPGARPTAATVERVLAEKSFITAAATSEPIPFQIEYSATDTELRHGLNLEARISHDGKVRHRTIHAHVVTLASAPFSHEVPVEPLP